MSHSASVDVLVISGAEVRRLLPMIDCIPLVESAMRSTSRGGAQLPLRIGVSPIGTPNKMVVMPGYVDEPACMGAKVIAVYPGNARRGLSSHMGVVVLFDVREGVPLAMIDAASITGMRTAAATAVATRTLSPDDACDLAIIGTGEQATAHLHAISLVRRLRTIRIWGRTRENAHAFAQREASSVDARIEVCGTIRDALIGADIVCTTTSASEPIVQGAWIARGAHVNLIGASTAPAREVDDALVKQSSFFVDYRPSALAQAGELLGAMGTDAANHIRGEIGEVLNGVVPGRTDEFEITVYKSLGIAAQDLVTAQEVYRRAKAEGAGVRAPL